MLALLALLISPALAADSELSLELASMAAPDPALGTFGTHTVPSFGVRAGVQVHNNVSAVLSWHHTRRGADLYVNGTEFAARAAWFGNELALGAKADVSFGDVFMPYAVATGVVLLGSARLDDDPDVNDNPGQVREGAVAFGARPMAGVELRMPRSYETGLTGAVYIELGWTFLTPLDHGDLGDLRAGGFTANGGIGFRY